METHNYIREDKSLINTDNASLVAYKATRQSALRLTKVESDVTDIKRELAEIRSFLEQIKEQKGK